MIFHKETKKSKHRTIKIIYFTYRKKDYTMYVVYKKDIDTTVVTIYKPSKNGNDYIPSKSSFIYGTKCLNVQQHINNFIIELKEQGL